MRRDGLWKWGTLPLLSLSPPLHAKGLFLSHPPVLFWSLSLVRHLAESFCPAGDAAVLISLVSSLTHIEHCPVARALRQWRPAEEGVKDFMCHPLRNILDMKEDLVSDSGAFGSSAISRRR